MNLTPLRANMTELQLNNGDLILFSYRTPVAAYIESEGKWYKTEKKWSVTTSRHINKWADRYHGTKPQEFFDGLTAHQENVKEAK